MPLDAKLAKFHARAQRVIGDRPVAEVVRKVRAIIGPSRLPPSEPLAQAALNKLHRGQAPSADELTALEIVVRMLRPVVFSRDGKLDDLPESSTESLYSEEVKHQWSEFRSRLQPVMGSIGRVEFANGRHIGSGFMVSDSVLATNRHVLDVLSFGSEALARGAARVVFKQETGLINTAIDIVPIEGVIAVHPTLDIALLQIAKRQCEVAKLATAPVAEGAYVVTIGYPGDDPINNPLFLSSVFGGKFGVKRAALGEALDGSVSPAMFHDCSTTQGNSGSPIFCLASATIAGIHRAGFFMYRNEAVDRGPLQEFIAAHR